MKYILFVLALYSSLSLRAQGVVLDTGAYLGIVKQDLQKIWPENRTINLVFHGHSVPAGYGDRHEVNTLKAYPHLLIEKLKQKYPYAVINVIVTAIGGENSIQGEARFKKEVLIHKPDVLFIDYALNDRFQDIQKVKSAYESMIRQAQAKGIKVILITPSPDQRLDIVDPKNPLDPFAEQIKELSQNFNTGLADPYTDFKALAKNRNIKKYMASVNHPNASGHAIIADELMRWF